MGSRLLGTRYDAVPHGAWRQPSHIVSRRGVSYFGWLSSNRRLYDPVYVPLLLWVTFMLPCPPHCREDILNLQSLHRCKFSNAVDALRVRRTTSSDGRTKT